MNAIQDAPGKPCWFCGKPVKAGDDFVVRYKSYHDGAFRVMQYVHRKCKRRTIVDQGVINPTGKAYL